MFANGPAVDERRRVLERLHQIRRERVAQDRRHRAVRVEIARSHRAMVPCVSDDDLAQALAEVGEARREAEHGHHLARDDDVETRLARDTRCRAAEADDDVAQRAVVHVEHASPGDPAHVDAERVAAMDVVVDECGEQIRRHGDRREVTREVEVDVLHGNDLRVAAAGCAALHAEHRAERRFAQADHRAAADPVERVAEPDGGRRLALAGRRGRDGRHEHELAVRSILEAGEPRAVRPSPCSGRTARARHPGCRGARRSAGSAASAQPGRSRCCSGACSPSPDPVVCRGQPIAGIGRSRRAGEGRQLAAMTSSTASP